MSFGIGCVHWVKSQGFSAQNKTFLIFKFGTSGITKVHRAVTWRQTVMQSAQIKPIIMLWVKKNAYEQKEKTKNETKQNENNESETLPRYLAVWFNGLFSASLSRFPAPREIIHNYDFERKKGIVIFYKILLSTEFVNTLTPTTIY